MGNLFHCSFLSDFTERIFFRSFSSMRISFFINSFFAPLPLVFPSSLTLNSPFPPQTLVTHRVSRFLTHWNPYSYPIFSMDNLPQGFLHSSCQLSSLKLLTQMLLLNQNLTSLQQRLGLIQEKERIQNSLLPIPQDLIPSTLHQPTWTWRYLSSTGTYDTVLSLSHNKNCLPLPMIIP